MISASLYIHIPFCDSFCDYCDFYSVNKDDYKENYIDAFVESLISDIKYQITQFNINEIPTVYIGGGTPSVLGAKIGVLLKALKSIPFFSPIEFTIEANPEFINKEFLEICFEGGVNRLSLGVQSFNQKSRDTVNRKGSIDNLQNGLNLVSGFGRDFSVDLIAGLPFQDILDDIKRVLFYGVQHISLYSLTLEKETPLYKKVKNKELTLPDEEESDLLWLKGRDALINAGFEHYEISNFAKNGKICMHNTRYWKMRNWIGAGPSASGTIINGERARRYTYSNDIDAYIKEPLLHTAIYEELDKNLLLKERILMGFRLSECQENSFKEYIPKTLAKWQGKDKMLFLNSFLQDAFSEIG